MLRIAVLVSGGGTNLEALFRAQESGIIRSGRIELVIADRPAYALERAQSHGCMSMLISRRELGMKAFAEHLAAALEENRIDMVVLAGFLSILPEEAIDRYEGRMINIHPSLIPSFCGKGFYGLRVHEAALERGVKVTGATVHLVNGIADGGRILMQKAVSVEPGDTPETLQRRVMEEAEWEILPLCTEMIASAIGGSDENR